MLFRWIVLNCGFVVSVLLSEWIGYLFSVVVCVIVVLLSLIFFVI